jgi:hypothetical protein
LVAIAVLAALGGASCSLAREWRARFARGRTTRPHPVARSRGRRGARRAGGAGAFRATWPQAAAPAAVAGSVSPTCAGRILYAAILRILPRGDRRTVPNIARQIAGRAHAGTGRLAADAIHTKATLALAGLRACPADTELTRGVRHWRLTINPRRNIWRTVGNSIAPRHINWPHFDKQRYVG